MTIYEMLFREDIYGIIEKTLEEYYLKAYGKTVSVKVQRNRLSNDYVIYPRLGVVVSRFPSFRVMKDIYNSFNVQNSIIKKMIAWGYITICLLTFGLLAPKSLRVSDKSVINRNGYIMPCNRKLRIFDYSKGVVDAILKQGFSDVCFKTELRYRINPNFGFIPPVLENGERWYRERIIEGHSLVRLPELEYKKVLDVVCDDVRAMYENSIEYVNVEKYCKPIAEYINSKIPFLTNEKNIGNADYVKAVVGKSLQIISSADIDVPVVLSHGDLQTGNIRNETQSGQVFIYDWETADRRSVWFDAGKLLLYSQRKGKYANMVNGRNDSEIKEKILFFDRNKEYPMDAVASVLVLEELKFFVEEICDLPGSMGTEIMYRLTDELEQTSLFA